MKTLTLEIPEFVNINEQEARSLIASMLYEKAVLSLGQAAELAGLSKRAFMETLAKYDVSVFNYPASEIENDIINVQSHHL